MSSSINSTISTASGSPLMYLLISPAYSGIAFARSIKFLSSSSTVVGCSLTISFTIVMASLKLLKKQTPNTFCFGISHSFNFTLLNKDKVPSEPTRMLEVLNPLGLIKSMLYPPTLLWVIGKCKSISSLVLSFTSKKFLIISYLRL